MNQNLLINFFINDDFYPIIRFEKIIETKYYKSHEVLNTQDFNEALGGLEILVDKHKAIFNSNEFHSVQDPFYFILETLVLLNVINSEYFSRFKMSNGSKCRMKIENDQELIFEPILNDNLVLLSFVSKNPNSKKSRNNPYFIDFEFYKDEWIEQSIIAINEFIFIVKNNDELKNDGFWKVLIEEWERVSAS